MTYSDFKEQTENLTLPMIGYFAVANIQGAEFEDASAYFLKNCFGNFQSELSPYVIVDDTNLSEDIIIDKSKESSKIIYVSEFGERVMEYVNSMYKEKQTITDATTGINSYEWTVEQKDITENSCKLVSTLDVNINADFSKIKGYANQTNEAFLNKDITKDNADYIIMLKVRQKCRFESTKKITGHELFGSSCDLKEVNDNCIEITGTNIGNSNGYIYIGEMKKSFFITVESNNENQTLELIKLKIETSNNNNTLNENRQQSEQQQPKETSKNNTKTQGKLPQTGLSNTIYILIILNMILIIILGLKLKKYNI